MALDTQKVGANDRSIILVGDPNTASQNQSVLLVSDARSLAGLSAGVVQSVQMLLNASGTFDRRRSAPGTTGIAAVNTEGTKATYSCGIVGFTPVATATDMLILVGSATKVVRLLRISISGFATSAITKDILLIKRLTAATGGTAAAQTIGQHDSNDVAPTAVVNLYSVDPTPGSSGGIIRAEKLNLGVTGSAGKVTWDFTTRNGEGVVLRGVAQGLALNNNSQAIASGTSLDIDLEFTEE